MAVELDEFWALIQVLGPRPRDEDFARLTDALATRSPEDITGFEDRLTALLYALDTPAHAAAARARNDWFLYVRCAAVAAGRSVYEGVIVEPARLRRFARREAELLLPVAGNAYERRTGMLWEHRTQVSYESGSNTAAWGQPEPSPEHPEHPDPVPWLSLQVSVFLPNGWPAAYDPLIEHIRQAVTADPGWQRWWSAADIPECHLSLLLTTDDRLGMPGTTVKVGRTRVQVDAVRRPAPLASTDPQDVLSRAVHDVTGMFDAVRAHVGLPPLPPLHLPAVPTDLPQGIERPETIRQLLAGAGLKSLLKAAVSLFGRPGRRNQQ